MHVVALPRYGSAEVLRWESRDCPTPGPGQVLVDVAAAALAKGDWHVMTGTPFVMRLGYSGFPRPKFDVLGTDMAGTVSALGEGVTDLAVGDAVMGDLSVCGFGACAERVCVPATALAPKPASLSFEEAAALPVSGQTALAALRDVGGVAAGQRVLVIGAAGGVGSFAVQIAKAAGAEVTGVCSTKAVAALTALGVDHVVDRSQHDVAADGPRFDLIIDTANHRPLRESLAPLAADGTYVMVGGAFGRFLEVALLGRLRRTHKTQTVRALAYTPTRDGLVELARLADAGQLRPLIDSRFPLARTADAMRHLVDGHPTGKIVLTV